MIKMETKSDDVDSTHRLARDDTVLKTEDALAPKLFVENGGGSDKNERDSCVEASRYDDQDAISSACLDKADDEKADNPLRGEDAIKLKAAQASIKYGKGKKESDTSANTRRLFDNPGHAAVGNDDDNDSNGASNFKVTNAPGDIPPVRGISIDEQERQCENMNVGVRERSTQPDESDSESSSRDILDLHSDDNNMSEKIREGVVSAGDIAREIVTPLLSEGSDTRDVKDSFEMNDIISSSVPNKDHENERFVRGGSDATEAGRKTPQEDASGISGGPQRDTASDKFHDVYGDEPDGAMPLLASQVMEERMRNRGEVSWKGEVDHSVHTSAEKEIRKAEEEDKVSHSSGKYDGGSSWKDGASDDNDSRPIAAQSTTAIIHTGSHLPGETSKEEKRGVGKKVEQFPPTDEISHGNRDNNLPNMAAATGQEQEASSSSLFSTGVSEATVHSRPVGVEDVVVDVEVMESDNQKHETFSDKEESLRKENSDRVSSRRDISDMEDGSRKNPEGAARGDSRDSSRRDISDVEDGHGSRENPDSAVLGPRGDSRVSSRRDISDVEDGHRSRENQDSAVLGPRGDSRVSSRRDISDVVDGHGSRENPGSAVLGPRSGDFRDSSKEGAIRTLAKSGFLVAMTDVVEEQVVDGAPRADIVEKADDWLVEWVQSCGMKEKTPPLHIRLKQYRERVLTQKTVKASGFVVLKNTRRKKIQQLSNFWNNVTYSLALWGRSIRKVEGVHGAGVASYFMFLRWLFGFNIFLFIFMGGFIVLPMAVLEETELTASSVAAYNTSYYCSQNYTVVKGSGFSVVLELIQGSGWMEKTPLFYGHYPNGVKAAYNLPLAYVLTVIGCLGISLILMARYTGHSFKEALLTNTNTNFEYSNKVFGAWDYSLTNHNAADLKMKGITYDIQSEMIEQAFMRKRIERLENRCSKCWLYFLRVLVNFFIILSLGGAAYLIYYVTSWSTQYSSTHADATGTDSWLLLLVQYMPSLTITLCNAILPLIFEKIVLLEDYSQVFIIKITLVRTVFLRLASLIVLVITLYSEISCTPKDSCNANQEPSCTNIKCWETYVGQQFYKLVVMDFLVACVKVLVVELPRRFFTSKCQSKLLEKIGPPEFNIPSNVLDLVYGECLVWLGFLFSPMLPGVVILKSFVIFYVKLLSALVACPPTERPYKASRINTFFMVILLVAFFLCSLPVIYTIFGIPPSKACGPFRVYDYMNIAIKNDVKTWPSVLSLTYDFITSAAFTAAVIIILGVAVYYMSTKAKAHKQQAELYKEQLIMEGRDKQFLLSKFQEMYTPSKPDPKKPDKKNKKGTDQVALVNEKHDPTKGSNPPQSFSPPNAADDSGW